MWRSGTREKGDENSTPGLEDAAMVGTDRWGSVEMGRIAGSMDWRERAEHDGQPAFDHAIPRKIA